MVSIGGNGANLVRANVTFGIYRSIIEQVTCLPPPKSEAQASGWCCIRSTFLQIVLIFSSSCHLRVTDYNFPLHMHILCIRIGAVLANTAFCVCVYIVFVCPYVATSGECYYNSLLLCCKYFSSSSMVSRAFSAPCHACIRSLGIILIP